MAVDDLKDGNQQFCQTHRVWDFCFLFPGRGTEYMNTHDSLPTYINWDLWRDELSAALGKRDK